MAVSYFTSGHCFLPRRSSFCPPVNCLLCSLSFDRKKKSIAIFYLWGMVINKITLLHTRPSFWKPIFKSIWRLSTIHIYTLTQEFANQHVQAAVAEALPIGMLDFLCGFIYTMNDPKAVQNHKPCGKQMTTETEMRSYAVALIKNLLKNC